MGDRALVERCVVTLAGERELLLVGEPGTAKSLLSELLSAAVCGTSGLVVQGTARNAKPDQLQVRLELRPVARPGSQPDRAGALPVLTAMARGGIARVEEVTRCLPEVQDALVSLLSERRIAVPELWAPRTPWRTPPPASTSSPPARPAARQGRVRDVRRPQARLQLRDGRPHPGPGRRDGPGPQPGAGLGRGRRLAELGYVPKPGLPFPGGAPCRRRGAGDDGARLAAVRRAVLQRDRPGRRRRPHRHPVAAAAHPGPHGHRAAALRGVRARRPGRRGAAHVRARTPRTRCRTCSPRRDCPP
ncbi:hypothetical protein STENM36S_05075 [Streptomyces tendae]